MRCMYCDTDRGPFHLDHVVPRSRGGPDDPLNIVTACQRCNLAKGDQIPSEWLQQVPYTIARIEQRVATIVARRTRRGGQVETVAPPRIFCDACGRDAFPSLNGMHVAWWDLHGLVGSDGPTEVLAFEVLCTGPDRCVVRKEREMLATHGRAAHIMDLPISSFFGRWAWVQLQSLVRRHVFSPELLQKVVRVMRQLSKVRPEDEPTDTREEDDDPEMVDD